VHWPGSAPWLTRSNQTNSIHFVMVRNRGQAGEDDAHPTAPVPPRENRKPPKEQEETDDERPPSQPGLVNHVVASVTAKYPLTVEESDEPGNRPEHPEYHHQYPAGSRPTSPSVSFHHFLLTEDCLDPTRILRVDRRTFKPEQTGASAGRAASVGGTHRQDPRRSFVREGAPTPRMDWSLCWW